MLLVSFNCWREASFERSMKRCLLGLFLATWPWQPLPPANCPRGGWSGRACRLFILPPRTTDSFAVCTRRAYHRFIFVIIVSFHTWTQNNSLELFCDSNSNELVGKMKLTRAKKYLFWQIKCDRKETTSSERLTRKQQNISLIMKTHSNDICKCEPHREMSRKWELFRKRKLFRKWNLLG